MVSLNYLIVRNGKRSCQKDKKLEKIFSDIEDSYRRLYRDGALWSYAMRMGRSYGLSSMDAQDLMQESMARFLRVLLKGLLPEEAMWRPYISGIMRNVARDRQRKLKKEQYFDADEFLASFGEIPDNSGALSEEVVRQAQIGWLIRVGLDKLGTPGGEVLRAFYFDKKSMEQISKEFGYADAAQSRKAVHRYRQKLRELLLANPRYESILQDIRGG